MFKGYGVEMIKQDLADKIMYTFIVIMMFGILFIILLLPIMIILSYFNFFHSELFSNSFYGKECRQMGFKEATDWKEHDYIQNYYDPYLIECDNNHIIQCEYDSKEIIDKWGKKELVYDNNKMNCEILR